MPPAAEGRNEKDWQTKKTAPCARSFFALLGGLRRGQYNRKMINSPSAGRLCLFISAALVAVFTVNLCIGKYRLWSGTGTSAPLDGVPEFFVLLAAVALAVAAALRQEQRQARTAQDGDG